MSLPEMGSDNSRIARRMLSDYRSFFFTEKRSFWYHSVVASIVDSATAHEMKLRQRKPPEQLSVRELLYEDYEPYELIIEHQIGMVLVLCQAYISTVVSRVASFHKDHSVLCGANPNGPPYTTKWKLEENFGNYSAEVGCRKIQLVDALGNFYKHSEEWPSDSRDLTRDQRRTADIVSRAGAKVGMNLGWSRSLSVCVSKLGVRSVSDLSLLVGVVSEWKVDIGKSSPELAAGEDSQFV